MADRPAQPSAPAQEPQHRPDEQVPTCDSGPAGRLRFVVREVRDLLRRRER